jgi:hypothetical protein
VPGPKGINICEKTRYLDMIHRINVIDVLGPLAQSVEQQTFNLWVVGSIPTGPTLVIDPR